VPDLVDGIPDDLDPDRPVWVMCVTGYRAEIAVRYLEAAGLEPIVVIGGGVPEALASLGVSSTASQRSAVSGTGDLTTPRSVAST
jgi:predicted sulfurtransferase